MTTGAASPRPSAARTPPAATASPNAAISLRDLLGTIQRTLRELPRAWVRAEVQKVSGGDRISSVELIETDQAGKVVASGSHAGTSAVFVVQSNELHARLH